jgi:hypothetical protein
MEISHASQETQVAAVGINGQAEEVTVSTDAEFMMMIAHGIYSNKALALVRELLCNARDGHAKAGCLDKPIHITLTDNLLVVRDHGTGIPNAIFAKTYMTFGKSTKRQDKAATGGFGVGTKVPWAVCDVFSARNWIDGTMTAYSIVKSDPKKEGKPTCTPIMTIPSTEPSGVEVSVPFPEKMCHEIKRYIRLFSEELGIPLIVNGNPILVNYIQINELKQFGFVRLTDGHPATVIQKSPFYVRQGDVIYPIEEQEEFSDAWEMLNYLTNTTNMGGAPILFLAEPDSIIPTLSRESLQYTDRTSKSIRELMKKVLTVLETNLDTHSDLTAEKYPDFVAKLSSFNHDMWSHELELHKHFRSFHNKYLKIPGLSPSYNFLLCTNMERWFEKQTPYLETAKISGKDFREDIEAVIKTKFIDSLKKYTYLHQDKLLRLWYERRSSRWAYSRNFIKESSRNAYEEVMRWRAEADFNPNIVDVYITKSEDFRYINSNSTTSRYFLEVKELKDLFTRKEHLFDSINYLRETLFVSKTVIISTTLANMIERFSEKFSDDPTNNTNIFMHSYARIVGARCVRVKATIKPHEIQKLKAEYESWGYDVLVLMDPTKAQLEERERVAAERALLRAAELPKLNELLLATGSFEDIKLSKRKLKGILANPKFKGEPLYIILPRAKELMHNLRTHRDFFKLAKFIGTDIVCVSTKSEIQRVIKEGRRNAEEAILEVAQWFFRRQDIYEKLFYRESFFLRRAKQDKYLTLYLFNRLPPVLSKEEETIYTGLFDFSTVFPKLRQYMNERKNFFSSCCTPAQHYYEMFSSYSESHFCDVHRALDVAYSRKPSSQRAIARSILKTILKGPK